jgi:hypothetical protein
MASVTLLFGTRVSTGPGDDFEPGETHAWSAWGYSYGDAVSVTAHPVPDLAAWARRALVVENIHTETLRTGVRLIFTVRNVGSTPIPRYGLGVGWIGR